jgi:hypothetical protein
MKLVRLAIDPDGDIKAIIAIPNPQGVPEVVTRYLTPQELRKVVDIYNTVADVAEGSNNLPYQMTFQLLKDEDIVNSVIESMEPELGRHHAS